jgi:hypothetical protein
MWYTFALKLFMSSFRWGSFYDLTSAEGFLSRCWSFISVPLALCTFGSPACPKAVWWRFRPRSVSRDWSSGLIPSRITSLIYIDFDELEWIRVYSGRSERALSDLRWIFVGSSQQPWLETSPKHKFYYSWPSAGDLPNNCFFCKWFHIDMHSYL